MECKIAGCPRAQLKVMHWNLYETEVIVELVFQVKTTESV